MVTDKFRAPKIVLVLVVVLVIGSAVIEDENEDEDDDRNFLAACSLATGKSEPIFPAFRLSLRPAPSSFRFGT